MRNIILLFALFNPIAVYMNAQELEVEGGVKIGDVAEEPPPGTIRWTGIDFEGWNGLDWVSLTNLPYEISFISDNDNNEYRTVMIGDREWMAENLRTARYNDNVFIPRKISSTDWENTSEGAWCWYDNDFNYDVPYGKLYNWYAVNTGKLCPLGWHVPSTTEWTELEDYLGGMGVAGGKMKQTDFTHWESPNSGASNESGFTGLPGGARILGIFDAIGQSGNWWSSTNLGSDAWLRSLFYSQVFLGLSTNSQKNGLAVRCVKDSP